ncbi:Intracellular phospholipase A2 [Caenorhabditis elegans]|uniref:Intracellular phospholipase A2 n=1 Tax=Caenorhabditis elegans TaxID=6239 RepID=PLA2_CAEEL|nr:Intracellular phospholipase A2 [Caenorhabditis elegans]Q20500.1 RecName: Full=Intracellular phospholipase A2; Short=IPLA-2; Short=PLA(2); AltName: Full=Calcium-independent phospholipase A2 [Caenorhabditis elegans]CAA90061.1 Intracellular phospholipase A2 [Caenorhabditis elegans]|eukprot:NP_509647.1 Intracelllar PhosphoLipase A family [Caenorhabditis elegans]
MTTTNKDGPFRQQYLPGVHKEPNLAISESTHSSDWYSATSSEDCFQAASQSFSSQKSNGNVITQQPGKLHCEISDPKSCSFVPAISTDNAQMGTSGIIKYRSYSNPDLLVAMSPLAYRDEAPQSQKSVANSRQDLTQTSCEVVTVSETVVNADSITTTTVTSSTTTTATASQEDFIMVEAEQDETAGLCDATMPLVDKKNITTSSTTSSPSRQITPRIENGLSFENVVSLVKIFPAFVNKLLKKPWYASRCDEVCQFPKAELAYYDIVSTDVDDEHFVIVAGKVTTDEHLMDNQFHLVFAPVGFSEDVSLDERPFSLFRATDKKDLMDLLHLCDEKSFLFTSLDMSTMRADILRSKIEELVIQIRLKPHYHMIHVAIATDRLDFFSDGMIKTMNETLEPFESQLRCLCHTENCYPVHLALTMDRQKIVERLLELDPTLFCETDKAGNNVWHHVNSSFCAQIIWDRCPASQHFIDERNMDGQSPLNEAVSTAKPLVATFLIGKGAKFTRGDRNELFVAMTSKNAQSVVEVVLTDKPEIANERDALGNSAIHVALYKESLNALLNRKVELGLDIDVKNNAGETALLLFITTRKPDLLPLLVTLYAHGANMNATDPHGNTALHKSAALVDAKKISLECVKFLISAGSNPNKINLRGESPRHLAASLQNQEMLAILKAAGATRCPKGYKGCRSNCRHDCSSAEDEYEETLQKIRIGNESDYEKTEFTASEKLNIQDTLDGSRRGKKAKVNLISMDGGGIRGLVIIQTLIAIEERLGDDIFKYFDWSAGTSTGSLIMAGLATGKSLREMQQTYLLLKDRVFDGIMPPYDTVQLEKFIQDQFGTGTVWEIPYPRLMISAVNSEKLPVRLEMARNYKPAKDVAPETPKEMPLWMALRRSTAAPVLFKPSEDRYIDGGIISNNPALDLMSEVHAYNRELQLSGRKSDAVQMNVLVSFGTGQIPSTVIETLSIDSNSPLQSIKTIKNLAAMFIDQATASEGAPVARSRQWADSLEIPFFRFSAPLSKNIFLSSTSDLDVCTMMWDSFIYCRKHRDYIDELVKVLKHDTDHPHVKTPFTDL